MRRLGRQQHLFVELFAQGHEGFLRAAIVKAEAVFADGRLDLAAHAPIMAVEILPLLGRKDGEVPGGEIEVVFRDLDGREGPGAPGGTGVIGHGKSFSGRLRWHALGICRSAYRFQGAGRQQGQQQPNREGQADGKF